MLQLILLIDIHLIHCPYYKSYKQSNFPARPQINSTDIAQKILFIEEKKHTQKYRNLWETHPPACMLYMHPNRQTSTTGHRNH